MAPVAVAGTADAGCWQGLAGVPIVQLCKQVRRVILRVVC